MRCWGEGDPLFLARHKGCHYCISTRTFDQDCWIKFVYELLGYGDSRSFFVVIWKTLKSLHLEPNCVLSSYLRITRFKRIWHQIKKRRRKLEIMSLNIPILNVFSEIKTVAIIRFSFFIILLLYIKLFNPKACSSRIKIELKKIR